MLFHSYQFVFLFLPVSLAGYWFLAGKGKGEAAKLWLAAASLWFYGSFQIISLLILLGSVAFNYGVYFGIGKLREADGESVGAEGGTRAGGKGLDGRREAGAKTCQGCAGARRLLAVGVAGNLALLGYFKYMNFFLDNLYWLFGREFTLWKIFLPVGISFFTFQQISFLVDGYRGEVRNCSFLDYLLYIVYFPKLVEGPLVNHGELLPQFAAVGRKKLDGERFIQGIALFVMGLLKKVILADTFGGAVDYGYANLEWMHGWDAALLVVFYALQLYFDFSGYCDMARGIGWMFGIELPLNFNSPYKARNILDFWKRWHMTLTRFFTQYVYIPLGGNREGVWKMYRNLLVVFLLSGIWHGAGWNFMLWGMMHGILYALTRCWQEGRKKRAAALAHGSRWENGDGREGERTGADGAWAFGRRLAGSVAKEGKEAAQGAEKCEAAGRKKEENKLIKRKEEENKTVKRKTKKGGTAGQKAAACLGRMAAVAATFAYVSVAWVYFRAESVAKGTQLLGKLFRNDFVRVNRNLAGYFNLDEFWYALKILRLDRWEFGHYILMAALTAGSLLLVFFGKNAAQVAERMKPRLWNAALLAGLLLWCVLTFSEVSGFLYVNF